MDHKSRHRCQWLALHSGLARYLRRLPLRVTSRLTVEGACPSDIAIERTESPATRPCEISSRSANIMGRKLVLYRLHGKTVELCRVHFPEIPAQHFADRRLRNFVDELDVLGPFVIGQRFLAVGDYLFDSHIGIR